MAGNQDMIVKIELKPSIFTEEGALDALLGQIEKEVGDFGCDISTEAGRKQVASNAYLIARSKTALDELGKEMVSGWKNKAKRVDKKRKHVRDRLDLLKAKYRLPLTEWEASEKKRHEHIESSIARLKELAGIKGAAHGVSEITKFMDEVRCVVIDATYFGEFAGETDRMKAYALECLEKAMAEARQIEKDKIELEKLRKEAEQRKRKEAEEAQKKREAEIAEKAAREAAEKERLRVENEKREDFERKLAAAQAEKERIEKAVAEKEKTEREAADKERQRMLDVAHRQRVRENVVTSICGYGVSRNVAELLFQAIDKGSIQYVGIAY